MKNLEIPTRPLGVAPEGQSILTVENVTALTAVITTFLSPGSIATLSDGSSYLFSATATTGGITPTTGGGQWILKNPGAGFESSVSGVAERIACWGDSLTAGTGGNPFPEFLGLLSRFPVYNGGAPGETSTQIRARMIADSDRQGNVAIIWAGRNNYADPVTVKADIAAMVASLGHTRYLVLGILNASGEPLGNAGYNTIVALNQDLAELYGSRFVDIRAHLVSLYNPDDAQDVIDYGNSVTPSSLRYDNIHLNTKGYLAVAWKVYKTLVSGEISAAFSGRVQLTGNQPLFDIINTGAGGKSWRVFVVGATGQLRFTEIGNADWMVVDHTTGNVGIGTTAPIGKLSVSNAGNLGFEVDPRIAGGTQVNLLVFNRATGSYGKLSTSALHHDFAQGMIGVPRFANDAAAVAGMAAAAGDVYYNTTTNKLKVYTGAAFETITSA